MADVLRDPVRARMMGQAGRARVEQEFGWDRIAQSTIAVYDSLM